MVDDLLKRFDTIRTFAKDGKLAPHKPLLLLYALAKLKNENAGRIVFNDAEDVVSPLIQTYGPFRAKTTVAYPFVRLATTKATFGGSNHIRRMRQAISALSKPATDDCRQGSRTTCSRPSKLTPSSSTTSR